MRCYLLTLAAVHTLVATTAARADDAAPCARATFSDTVRLDAEDIPTASRTLRCDPERGNFEPKSPDKAQMLATVGTLAGPLLIYAGFRTDGPGPNGRLTVPLLVAGAATTVLGPSLGNWYAGEGVSAGLGVRIAGALAFGAGVSSFSFSSNDSNAAGVALVGVALVGVGALMDIHHAPEAAFAYNRSHAARSLAIAPTVSTASGARQTGLVLAGMF